MVTTLRIFIPAMLLASLWLVLTQYQLSSWIIGIPFIGLALLAIPSTRHTAAISKLHGKSLAKFLKLFVTESIHGGIDVSRRVLAAKPAVDPGFFDYPIRLQGTTARQLFISSISLLPGTLCADWVDDKAYIHALDEKSMSVDGIRRLEEQVAAMFGEKI